MSRAVGVRVGLSPESNTFQFFSHHLTPRSADVILVPAETIKTFAIYLTDMLDYFH